MHPLFEALRRGGSAFLRHPVPSLARAGRFTAGAAAPFLVGETAYRTAQNLADGKAEVGMPKTTGSIIGAPLNWLSDVTGVSGAVSTLAKNMIGGVVEAPQVQNTLTQLQDTTKTLGDAFGGATSAVNRATSALETPSVQRALQVGGEVASSVNNIADPAVQTRLIDLSTNAGAAAGKGALHGLGAAAFQNPRLLAMYLAMTAAPMIGYDLMTRKKRIQEKQLQVQLLRALKTTQRAQEIEKTGSVLDILRRVVYSDAKVAPHVFEQLARKATALGGLSAREFQQTANKFGRDWSLLNNPFSRNPLKTIGLGTAGVGGSMLAYDKAMKGGANSSPLDSMTGFVDGAIQGPINALTAVESRALQNGRYDAIGKMLPTSQLTDLRTNLTNVQTAAKELPEKLKTLYSKGSELVRTPLPPPTAPVPIPDAPVLDQAHPNRYYLGALAALASPYIAYGAYDKYHNRKEKVLDQRANNIRQTVIPS